MIGLKYLTRGCWNRLTVEMSLGRYGSTNKDNFILDMEVKNMM